MLIEAATKPYWISWWADKTIMFEWNGPWWVSGYRGDNKESIAAAVIAESEEDARKKILASHDQSVDLEWRFVLERPLDWKPFSDRFMKAQWMIWPYPIGY